MNYRRGSGMAEFVESYGFAIGAPGRVSLETRLRPNDYAELKDSPEWEVLQSWFSREGKTLETSTDFADGSSIHITFRPVGLTRGDYISLKNSPEWEVFDDWFRRKRLEYDAEYEQEKRDLLQKAQERIAQRVEKTQCGYMGGGEEE